MLIFLSIKYNNISKQVIFKTYATGKPIKKGNNVVTSMKKHLAASNTLSAFKSITKSYSSIKTNIKSFLWSLIVLCKLDKLITPKVIKILSVCKIIFKVCTYGFGVFNVSMFTWLFYYNYPTITFTLITGWILDFFKVAKVTYTDTIATFLDYLINIVDNGISNVPKHPNKPVEYPSEGFIDKYREIFEKLRDLPPRAEWPRVNKRWYDFLRDESITLLKTNNRRYSFR